ncbi:MULTISPECIES: SulP family inorganic anion transporter [Bacillus]|uniref:Sulfate transporter n=2 Tax=Bacillus TaxID=1386 RepID=A0A0M3RAF1_9BACI|nr:MULTISPECIES: SulP family inorganic anion transporter [Bacillus]ALC83066.1 sulfate transporter [Bacillus gobiensis]MBP1082109.1 SulP family sulfate permease [Bacillus capparidis]MED1096733.1 SulP family inorganic anion transporter [Bacillus capparidis]
MNLDAFRDYSLHNLKKDVLSGTVVGIIAIPLGLGFAIASGTSPVTGLYTTIVAGLLISILGGSRFQIGGPTGAFVPVLLGIILQFGFENLLIAGFMAGILLIIFGLCKVGNLIKFFPQSIIIGFQSGIAVIIFSGQIPNFLGLHNIEKYEYFHLNIKEIVGNLYLVGIYTIITALLCLLIIVIAQRYFPKVGGISYLLGILVSSLVSSFFYSNQIETIGSIYGEIPHQLPLPDFPKVTIEKIIYLLPSSFVIAILIGLQSLLTARVADEMTRSKHNSKKELIGQGIVNMVIPLFHGIPAAGEVARTVTNIKNGGSSPIAGITHALFVLLVLLLLAPYASHVALASLAPVLMVVSWNISKKEQFASILKEKSGHSLILMVTFLLTVFANLTMGIGAGLCLFAFMCLRKRMKDNQKQLKKAI